MSQRLHLRCSEVSRSASEFELKKLKLVKEMFYKLTDFFLFSYLILGVNLRNSEKLCERHRHANFNIIQKKQQQKLKSKNIRKFNSFIERLID